MSRWISEGAARRPPDSLGEPERRLDVTYGLRHLPSGEWVYAGAGTRTRGGRRARAPRHGLRGVRPWTSTRHRLRVRVRDDAAPARVAAGEGGTCELPGSPRLLKGGIVLVDAATGAIQRIIALQYNPDTLTPHAAGRQRAAAESATGAEALRLKGPPVETIKLDAEIDADRPARVRRRADAAEVGMHPQLAALERSSIRPARSCIAVNALAASGHARDRADAGAADAVRLEQAPHRAGADHRVQRHRGGVRPALNPIRAKVSLGLRVLSVDDLGFDHQGGTLFMAYLQSKEQLAARSRGGHARRARHSRDCHDERRTSFAAHEPLRDASRRRRGPAPDGSDGRRTCAAASCRRRSRFALLAGARRRRRASGSTRSPRSTSAIPSSSGASATPTARCSRDELTERGRPARAHHAAGRHARAGADA